MAQDPIYKRYLKSSKDTLFTEKEDHGPSTDFSEFVLKKNSNKEITDEALWVFTLAVNSHKTMKNSKLSPLIRVPTSFCQLFHVCQLATKEALSEGGVHLMF